MTTYVRRNGQIVDKATGEPIELKHEVAAPGYAMSDIAPFKSPLDFKTEISSRSQLREYEKRHGVRQVGTDFNSTYRKILDQHKGN